MPTRPPPSIPSTRQPVKTPSPIPPIEPPTNKLREKRYNELLFLFFLFFLFSLTFPRTSSWSKGSKTCVFSFLLWVVSSTCYIFHSLPSSCNCVINKLFKSKNICHLIVCYCYDSSKGRWTGLNLLFICVVLLMATLKQCKCLKAHELPPYICRRCFSKIQFLFSALII